MYQDFPIWLLTVDYLMGTIMWTLIGRFAMGIFLPQDSTWFFMRFFVRVTDPLIKLFKPITPKFLIEGFWPLYVAWFFYVIRFYLMPWIMGYSVMGMLSFPLESEFALGVSNTIKWIVQ